MAAQKILPYKVVIHSECESCFADGSTTVKDLLYHVTEKCQKRFAPAQVVCIADPSTNEENAVAQWFAEADGNIRVLGSVDFTAIIDYAAKKMSMENRLRNLAADLLLRYYALFVNKSKDLPLNFCQKIDDGFISLDDFFSALRLDWSNLNDKIWDNNGVFDETIVKKELENSARYPFLSKIIAFGEQRGLDRMALIKMEYLRRYNDLDLDFNFSDLKSLLGVFQKIN
jgi:hypothetical protein